MRRRSSINDWMSYAERKYGVPVNVQQGLVKVESGGDPNAQSSAGARGLTQFMPGTAKGYGVQFGSSPGAQRSQILGAAHYLHDLGFSKNPKLALSSYNAGPGNPGAAGNYADKVLAAAGGGPLKIKASPGIGGFGAPTTPSAAPQGPDLYGTLASLSKATDPDSLASSNYDFLQQLQMLSGPEQQSAGAVGAAAQGAAPMLGARVGSNNKLLKGHPLDRPGVPTGHAILNFAGQVASVYGHPITLGTGTAHNQMSTSGLQSAHWTGDALDLPAVGRQLIAMGQSALVAAGADPAWAGKQNGGLYNIGGKQIIFNTQEGGDHTNHLHIGLRRRK